MAKNQKEKFIRKCYLYVLEANGYVFLSIFWLLLFFKCLQLKMSKYWQRLSLNTFWNIKCLQEHNLSWAVAGRHEGRLRAALARAGAVVEADLKAGKEVLK